MFRHFNSNRPKFGQRVYFSGSDLWPHQVFWRWAFPPVQQL